MTGTRDRLVHVSAALLQRQGLTGTGIKQILSEAHAPFSSLYHHFPGGKDELARAAIGDAGARYQGIVEAVWDEAPDVISSVAAVFDGAARTLEETDFALGCPIATIALEVASTNEQLRLATAEVFDAWIAACTGRLEAENISADDARVLALTLISLLEGAFMLSQAMKSTEPMRAAGVSATAAVRSVLGPPTGGTRPPLTPATIP
ncbi:MAG TPA: TetR/AcrR family transcriptional regulator [Acidimicrobiales bacterium]|nr:TetR/AcrR family transcriptional regulator [Acidimicrobiales bacterium]